MDTTRFILIVALGALGLMLWNAWQEDYGHLQDTGVAQADVGIPTTDDASPQDLPDLAITQADSPELAPSDQVDSSALTLLESDVLRLKISPAGATIVAADLLDYPEDPAYPERALGLLTQNPNSLFVAETGLLSASGNIDHRTLFSPEARRYVMARDATSVTAVFQAKVGDVVVEKRITLNRGSYDVDVRYDIRNNGNDQWIGRPYYQLKRVRESGREGFIYTFTGAALSTPDNHYQKFSFDKLADKGIDATVTQGWVAFIQHYFLAAIVPQPDTETRFYSKSVSDNLFVVGAVRPPLEVAPGSRNGAHETLVIGPKLQDRLSQTAPHLELAVDYGWVWFIAKPLFWLLDAIHHLVRNWGIAIILVTVLLKMALYPLSAAGYRSMAKMRKLQPRLAALKDRFEGDRQGLNQAMMDLYKKEKVNPLGGCFPIVVQIPVFLSLYWVLLESVELRQAPFLLWIGDLSSKDPFFVLPLLMGLSMWFQQRLNPAPMDPMQAKVMQMMPIVMTGFFAFFPSGLVLYWVVNNVVSIAQQWYITRQVEKN